MEVRKKFKRSYYYTSKVSTPKIIVQLVGTKFLTTAAAAVQRKKHFRGEFCLKQIYHEKKKVGGNGGDATAAAAVEEIFLQIHLLDFRSPCPQTKPYSFKESCRKLDEKFAQV